MSNPADKTELQRLLEERDATLACLAICKVAQATVDQALQRINEERQPNTSKDDKRVISSLSELIGTSAWQSNRPSQTDLPCRTSRKVDGDTANPLQHTDLAHPHRKTPHSAKDLNQVEANDGRGHSTEDSQGEPDDDSFVMVDIVDEKDTERRS